MAAAAATLRSEILAFRMVELQQVAERLGLKKTGRKAELQSRVLAYFGELDPSSAAAAALGRSGLPRAPREQWRMEQGAKVVHDIYCRMAGLPAGVPSDQSAHSSLQVPSGAGAAYQAAAAMAYMQAQAQAAQYAVQMATDGGYRSQQYSQPPAGASQQQAHAPRRAVRCFCGLAAERGSMVQCQGRNCGVWQHSECVSVDPADTKAAKAFLCELCRARLADPFWAVTEQVLPPARLRAQPGRPLLSTAGGMQEVQSADRVFYLNQQQLEGAQRDPANHRVQVGCLLVSDEVGPRYHWPKHVDLKVNNIAHRPYGRAHNAKMGINQRDDAASIGTMVVRGRNSLSVSGADSGTWVLTLQLARRRSMQEVKHLMAPPESLADAVARVKRQVGGGGDDSDDDLLISHQVVSLKDPMSGQRMQVPARFTDASGLQSFDLDSFLSMAARSRKWQDPDTLANSSIEQLQVDVYMQRVLECLGGSSAVTEVEISAEGRWRPDGVACDYFDVAADPASVAAALAAAAARSGGAGGAKAEPAAVAAASGKASAGGSGTVKEELVVDGGSSEEEDEAEELRKAAAAVRRASSAALDALAGQKRKQAEAEVIDLCDSEDDGPARPAPAAAARPAPAQQQQQRVGGGMSGAPAAQQRTPAAAPAASPLRIRLPMRGRLMPTPQAQSQPQQTYQQQQQAQQQRQIPSQQAYQQQPPPPRQYGGPAAPQSFGYGAAPPFGTPGYEPPGGMFPGAMPGTSFMPASQMLPGHMQQQQQPMQGQPGYMPYGGGGGDPGGSGYGSPSHPRGPAGMPLPVPAPAAQQERMHEQMAGLIGGPYDDMDNAEFLHALFDDPF